MRLNELRDNPGATQARKRVGRGIGSGKGKTAGRGHKGQNSRSGVALKGFEGGQMPIHRRLPKRGFNNLFAKDSNTVNLGRVQSAIDKGTLDAKKPVTVEALLAAGVIRRALDGVRLLGDGEIKAKVAFEVTGASAGAVKAVEKAGGSVTIVEMPKRQAKPKEKPAKAPTKAEAKPAAPKKAEPKPAAKKTAKTAAKKPAAKKTAAKKPAAKKPAKKDK
jgi:large subunit ribosomal protein L15